MNRHYTFENYKETVQAIRKVFPNASISTDIIVGFPTETDEDFNDGLKNVSLINFSNVHIFPYSRREGTAAANLPQINGTIIKERLAKLKEITDSSKDAYIKNNLNTIHEVLIEEIKKGFYAGFTKNYLKTYIAPTQELDINKIYKVKIKAPYLDGVMGEIVKGE